MFPNSITFSVTSIPNYHSEYCCFSRRMRCFHTTPWLSSAARSLWGCTSSWESRNCSATTACGTTDFLPVYPLHSSPTTPVRYIVRGEFVRSFMVLILFCDLIPLKILEIVNLLIFIG